ncbi:MAG: ribonuclease Z [Bacteroidales bacterium]|nr:ribonuclease Z [Bacteroidales bacterium]
MKLTILGSSSALPTSERYPTAHVLEAHERLFLIDCGEGTQMQIRKNRIRLGKINHIFISHLHGDHVFGLYGLLSTFSLMGRSAPVNLYAPIGYDTILRSHLNDFDIHLDYEIIFTPLSGKDPVKILDNKFITVQSFPLKHRVPSFGFLFREKPGERNMIKDRIIEYKIPVSRIPAIKKGEDFLLEDGTIIKNEEITTAPPDPLSYAYCSDTRYFSRLSEFVKGVDLLYHEATFDSSLEKLAAKTGHSTTLDAARTARDAGVKALIIGHFSSRYRNISFLVEEARSIFPVTMPAIDGNSYTVGKILQP